jgi:hypothetical protein
VDKETGQKVGRAFHVVHDGNMLDDSESSQVFDGHELTML